MSWFNFAALLEQDCRLCGARARGALCDACDADLPRLPAARCPQCAMPAPAGQICGKCLGERPRFDATVAAFEYAFPATRLVQSFKYGNAVGLSRLLARHLGNAIAATHAPAVDLVIPMPLALPRLRERGYNQALELARALPLSQGTIEVKAVLRIRHGPPQAELPWKERRANVRGAFAARRRFDGLALAVVDDVMTTGATLDELAGALKSAGARSVFNWVLARTLPRRAQLPGDPEPTGV